MKEELNPRYYELADYLSDHLWTLNSLDYEFLKTFSEFTYTGIAYRVIFSVQNPDLRSFKHQSFAKSINGVKEYINNAITYDKDFVLDKIPFVYQCEINGFDLQLALEFCKKHNLLTKESLAFHTEEEVIAFDCSDPILITTD